MSDPSNTSRDQPFNSPSGAMSALNYGYLPSDFRRNIEELQATTEIDHWLEDVIYGQSVTAFVSVFLENPDKPHILQSLKSIWQTQGFLSPEQLVKPLLDIYYDDAPAEARDILALQIAERLSDIEPLTGFQRKQHAPLLTGLAHLHAIVMEQPASLVMADFSNMGGTNEFFRKLMAAERGVDIAQVDEKEAFALTDKAARIVSQLALDAYKHGATELYGVDNPHIYAHRTGGDEIAFVGIGINAEQSDDILNHYVMPAVEDFLAKAGLQQHEHAKARDDRWRDGFGVAFSSMALDRNTDPGHDLAVADQQISENKNMVGIRRRGKVPPSLALDSPEMQKLLQLMQDADALGAENPATTQAAAKPDAVDQPEQHITVDPEKKDFDPTQPIGSREKAKRKQFVQMVAAEKRDALLRLGMNKNELDGLKEDELSSAIVQRQIEALRDNAAAHAARYRALSVAAGTNHNPRLGVLSGEKAGQLLSNIKAVMEGERYGRFLVKAQPNPSAFADIQLPKNNLFRTQLERGHDLMTATFAQRGVQIGQGLYTRFDRILSCFSPVDPATRCLMGDLMPEIFGQFAKDADKLKAHISTLPETERQRFLSGVGAQKVDDLKARGLCVQMHNLAGVNKLLAHNNADIVLKHFANEVVKGSFSRMGIDPNSVEVGHDGGGRMVLAVRPIVKTADGSKAMDEKMMQQVQAEMHKRMVEFQNTPISTFIEQRGGKLPEGLDRAMTFGQVPDPKRHYYPGTDITSSYMTLQQSDAQGHRLTGGRTKEALVRMTEDRISMKRDVMLQAAQAVPLQQQVNTAFAPAAPQTVYRAPLPTEENNGQKQRPADKELRGNTLQRDGEEPETSGAGSYRAASRQRRPAPYAPEPPRPRKSDRS